MYIAFVKNIQTPMEDIPVSSWEILPRNLNHSTLKQIIFSIPTQIFFFQKMLRPHIQIESLLMYMKSKSTVFSEFFQKFLYNKCFTKTFRSLLFQISKAQRYIILGNTFQQIFIRNIFQEVVIESFHCKYVGNC